MRASTFLPLMAVLAAIPALGHHSGSDDAIAPRAVPSSTTGSATATTTSAASGTTSGVGGDLGLDQVLNAVAENPELIIQYAGLFCNATENGKTLPALLAEQAPEMANDPDSKDVFSAAISFVQNFCKSQVNVTASGTSGANSVSSVRGSPDLLMKAADVIARKTASTTKAADATSTPLSGTNLGTEVQVLAMATGLLGAVLAIVL